MTGQIFRDTDYYACRLLGIRVRVTLEHTVQCPVEEEAPATVSTRIVQCSGAPSCGWLHGDHRGRGGCPYRMELNNAEGPLLQ